MILNIFVFVLRPSGGVGANPTGDILKDVVRPSLPDLVPSHSQIWSQSHMYVLNVVQWCQVKLATINMFTDKKKKGRFVFQFDSFKRHLICCEPNMNSFSYLSCQIFMIVLNKYTPRSSTKYFVNRHLSRSTCWSIKLYDRVYLAVAIALLNQAATRQKHAGYVDGAWCLPPPSCPKISSTDASTNA
jgi:hypothetical protein